MADKIPGPYGFTVLMPDLPGDLVDADGRHVDYDGCVFRCDEVYAVLERKDAEIERLRKELEQFGSYRRLAVKGKAVN